MSENSFAEQRQIRVNKLNKFANGLYPNGFKPNDRAKNLHAKFDSVAEIAETEAASIAGRIMTKRLMGKACFITVKDATGCIQIYLRKDDLDNYALVEEFDLGDIVYVSGRIFKTKKGELSIWADSAQLVTKSLRPLPDKYHGLTDVEIRYRQRYLDLITNDDVMQIMQVRSQIVSAIRKFFINEDFLEVETPMMQVQPGGANAKPFATHLNALNLPLFLRIAPELYLKRLIVGGFEKVFELNKNFRNEGMSTRHNPEFTMIEFYQAYATYHDMMDLTEKLFAYLRNELKLETEIEYQGNKIDIASPFARISLEQLLIQEHGLNTNTVREQQALINVANKLNLKVENISTIGALQLFIFEETIEAKLIQPTFVTDYPIEVSPLARQSDHDPHLSDRFELFVVGRELANGFSELNDPNDQAQRFNAQMALRAGGDDEAMSFDDDYICALEYGMPPTAGQGIGIDRLVMLLTNQAAIRDVILFPTMRPRLEDSQQ